MAEVKLVEFLGIDLIIKKIQSHRCLAKSSNEQYVLQMSDVFFNHARKFQRKSTNKIWMNDPSKAWKQKQLHMSDIETDKLPKPSLVNQSRCGGKFPPQKIQDSMGFSDDPMKAPTVDAINIFSLKKLYFSG